MRELPMELMTSPACKTHPDRRPGRTLFQAAALGLILLFSGAAAAQDAPTTDDIAPPFAPHVPAGWTVEEIVIDAQENYGTQVEPDMRTRFRAIVTSESATFESTGELEGAVLLRPVLEAGEQRTFYGMATSVLHSGKWETTLELENNPTAATGSPIDAFSGRRIILGSEEETDFREQLEREATANTEAELKAMEHAALLRGAGTGRGTARGESRNRVEAGEGSRRA